MKTNHVAFLRKSGLALGIGVVFACGKAGEPEDWNGEHAPQIPTATTASSELASTAPSKPESGRTLTTETVASRCAPVQLPPGVAGTYGVSNGDYSCGNPTAQALITNLAARLGIVRSGGSASGSFTSDQIPSYLSGLVTLGWSASYGGEPSGSLSLNITGSAGMLFSLAATAVLSANTTTSLVANVSGGSNPSSGLWTITVPDGPFSTVDILKWPLGANVITVNADLPNSIFAITSVIAQSGGLASNDLPTLSGASNPTYNLNGNTGTIYTSGLPSTDCTGQSLFPDASGNYTTCRAGADTGNNTCTNGTCALPVGGGAQCATNSDCLNPCVQACGSPAFLECTCGSYTSDQTTCQMLVLPARSNTWQVAQVGPVNTPGGDGVCDGQTCGQLFYSNYVSQCGGVPSSIGGYFQGPSGNGLPAGSVANGGNCQSNAVCASGACQSGKCVAAPSGSGGSCKQNSDCQSGSCQGGICSPAGSGGSSDDGGSTPPSGGSSDDGGVIPPPQGPPPFDGGMP